ncbi:hypothetical protein CR155_07680 [Pollutimonas nitritireducens]|uniref:Uncharacterized protein n=1 Tax=Pollutimonas nitritireducens TaxID=2045209 RepID=A0A2N4UHX4_9BURK|nr:hypothetical protein [Pollutimonas nitritireducens]PLC54631.1 hypothetical protein CR155_07680 [Pollutimonas nitritireducens]
MTFVGGQISARDRPFALGAQWVGWLMSLATVCAIGGRYIAAVAVQRFGHRRAVAAAGYFVQAIGSAKSWQSGKAPTLLHPHSLVCC